MTLKNARKAAEWIVVLDQARAWREAFEKDRQKVILFENITGRPQIDGNGSGRGWDGHLAMRRSTAIVMMKDLEGIARMELQKLGVTP